MTVRLHQTLISPPHYLVRKLLTLTPRRSHIEGTIILVEGTNRPLRFSGSATQMEGSHHPNARIFCICFNHHLLCQHAVNQLIETGYRLIGQSSFRVQNYNRPYCFLALPFFLIPTNSFHFWPAFSLSLYTFRFISLIWIEDMVPVICT
jgi:hypothetical protein